MHLEYTLGGYASQIERFDIADKWSFSTQPLSFPCGLSALGVKLLPHRCKSRMSSLAKNGLLTKGEEAMRILVRSALFTGMLLTGASGLMASQTSNWFNEWHRSKLGRSSPIEEARQRAEQANTAYREEAAPQATANTWLEDLWKTKYGRNSPIEDARLRAEQENTAYREEAAPKAPPNIWFEDLWRAKYGRSSPLK